MTIVIPWAGTVQSYVEAGKEIEIKRPEFCPVCGYDHLVFWGGRFRFATKKAEDFRLYVRRVKCSDCSKTHTLLPAFLLRRRVHLADMILAALNLRFLNDYTIRATAKELGLSRSTIRRWLDKFRISAPGHYQRLCRLYHTHFCGAPPPALARGFPAAFLRLAGRLFVLQTSGVDPFDFKFASWLSSATSGTLLD